MTTIPDFRAGARYGFYTRRAGRFHLSPLFGSVAECFRWLSGPNGVPPAQRRDALGFHVAAVLGDDEFVWGGVVAATGEVEVYNGRWEALTHPVYLDKSFNHYAAGANEVAPEVFHAARSAGIEDAPR